MPHFLDAKVRLKIYEIGWGGKENCPTLMHLSRTLDICISWSLIILQTLYFIVVITILCFWFINQMPPFEASMHNYSVLISTIILHNTVLWFCQQLPSVYINTKLMHNSSKSVTDFLFEPSSFLVNLQRKITKICLLLCHVCLSSFSDLKTAEWVLLKFIRTPWINDITWKTWAQT
jgi:hypothetical protein